MPIHSYRGVSPQVGEGVFLAPTAYGIGDVQIGQRYVRVKDEHSRQVESQP